MFIGTITLNTLRETAEALQMKLIYAIIPKEQSLEKLIESHARELAEKIVLRTSASMKLEDQENTNTRLAKAINEKIEELKDEAKLRWMKKKRRVINIDNHHEGKTRRI